MERVTDKPVELSEKRCRYSVRVYDDPSESGMAARIRQIKFLQEFIDQPALLQCGPVFAQQMRFWHDGTRWVMAGEAEGERV